MKGRLSHGHQQEKWDSEDRKNTPPYAAQTAAEDCSKTAYDLGLRKVKVYVKDPAPEENQQSVQFIRPVLRYLK